MKEVCEKVVEELNKRGYFAVYCATKEEAFDAIMNEIKDVQRIGMGGAMTMKELGVAAKVEEEGKLLTRGADCEVFLLSANAITSDGRIVNIDGRGNRVAASIYGPNKVIYAIGRNKIVDGGIDAAIERIKEKACPPNCVRLDKKTPCAVTGKCADCNSPDRICKVTVVFDRCPTGTPTTVYVVDADLGY
ncbi:MAG: lactate utilization protein [Kiritimatiellae bacterium]|nr:lactate utilization protein [Kiritimatiellia bacterium]